MCVAEEVSTAVGLCASCHRLKTIEDEENNLRDINDKLRNEIEKLKQFIAYKELTTEWTGYNK